MCVVTQEKFWKTLPEKVTRKTSLLLEAKGLRKDDRGQEKTSLISS